MNSNIETNVWKISQDLLTHPVRRILLRWNWKSAILSSLIRAGIFFCTNLTAGWDAAIQAMSLEFVFRACASGFYGAITQSFSVAQPAILGTIVAMIILPVIAHSIEFVIHFFGGTENLVASIMASASFSVLSTLFNLYAMRRGVLLVGQSRQSFLQDIKVMPRILLDFVLLPIRFLLDAIQKLQISDRKTIT